MSKTLNELVRKQILAEGPQTPMRDAMGEYTYVSVKLDSMPNTELLERISDAFDKMRDTNAPTPAALATRLGI